MADLKDEITDEERVIVHQFRDRLKDIHILLPETTDWYFYRWLKARNFDQNKSEKMIRDSMEWRERVGADSILDDYTLPEVWKFYPGGLYGGVDKEGNPLLFDTPGLLDSRGLLHSLKKSDIIRAKVHTCEKVQRRLREESKKQGRHVRGLTVVYDMDQYGLKHLWKPAMDVHKEVAAMFEAHYPETLKKTFVINGPTLFPVLFNLAKPFISEETKKKVFLLGSDYKTVLNKHIDADQFPVHWGGAATDPDGDTFCQSQMGRGGTIPESYYIAKTDVLTNMDDYTQITVSSGSTYEAPIEVEKAGSVLRWQFFTESKDINFNLYRKMSPEQTKPKDMHLEMSVQNVTCYLVPEDNSHRCTHAGTYVMQFDNSYSWVTSKKVWYLVDVLLPSKQGINDLIGDVIKTTHL